MSLLLLHFLPPPGDGGRVTAVSLLLLPDPLETLDNREDDIPLTSGTPVAHGVCLLFGPAGPPCFVLVPSGHSQPSILGSTFSGCAAGIRACTAVLSVCSGLSLLAPAGCPPTAVATAPEVTALPGGSVGVSAAPPAQVVPLDVLVEVLASFTPHGLAGGRRAHSPLPPSHCLPPPLRFSTSGARHRQLTYGLALLRRSGGCSLPAFRPAVTSHSLCFFLLVHHPTLLCTPIGTRWWMVGSVYHQE